MWIDLCFFLFLCSSTLNYNICFTFGCNDLSIVGSRCMTWMSIINPWDGGDRTGPRRRWKYHRQITNQNKSQNGFNRTTQSANSERGARSLKKKPRNNVQISNYRCDWFWCVLCGAVQWHSSTFLVLFFSFSSTLCSACRLFLLCATIFWCSY